MPDNKDLEYRASCARGLAYVRLQVAVRDTEIAMELSRDAGHNRSAYRMGIVLSCLKSIRNGGCPVADALEVGTGNSELGNDKEAEKH